MQYVPLNKDLQKKTLGVHRSDRIQYSLWALTHADLQCSGSKPFSSLENLPPGQTIFDGQNVKQSMRAFAYPTNNITEALFSSEKWKVFGTVALSFVCDKYYLIIN